MNSWPFAYVLSETADAPTAHRTILQFERTFGLLTPDESTVWTHRHVTMMLLFRSPPRRLWMEGRVALDAIAMLNRN